MKLIIKLACVAVALVLGLVIAGFIYIDTVAKAAIETGATFALGVDTTVEEVAIGIFSGTSEIAGLKVANPENYTTAYSRDRTLRRNFPHRRSRV